MFFNQDEVQLSVEYIHRTMEQTFQRLAQEYPALLLTGPRQIGKTTMLKALMQSETSPRRYITLDDPNDRTLAKEDPELFFQINPPPILIDEVQYAPELFPAIKRIVDQNQRAGDFWLTGSQLFKTLQGVQESLAGRIALLHLSTLTQQELKGQPDAAPFMPDLLRLSQLQEQIEKEDIRFIFERIFLGSMPGLASGRYTDRHVYYSSYIGTYLDRDIRDISSTIDTLKFSRFITAAACRSSQLVNFKALADESEINQQTAKNWLRILEALGIVFLLQPYSNNALTRLVKTPKLYFADTGLVAYLARWESAETLLNGAMSGAIFENYIISEIRKSYLNSGREPFLYFYRDTDGYEIDLVFELDGQLHPIEIKKSAAPGKQMIRAFRLLEKTGLPRGTGAVICAADHLSAFDRDNLIIPASLI